MKYALHCQECGLVFNVVKTPYRPEHVAEKCIQCRQPVVQVMMFDVQENENKWIREYLRELSSPEDTRKDR